MSMDANEPNNLTHVDTNLQDNHDASQVIENERPCRQHTLKPKTIA